MSSLSESVSHIASVFGAWLRLVACKRCAAAPPSPSLTTGMHSTADTTATHSTSDTPNTVHHGKESSDHPLAFELERISSGQEGGREEGMGGKAWQVEGNVLMYHDEDDDMYELVDEDDELVDDNEDNQHAILPLHLLPHTHTSLPHTHTSLPHTHTLLAHTYTSPAHTHTSLEAGARVEEKNGAHGVADAERVEVSVKDVAREAGGVRGVGEKGGDLWKAAVEVAVEQEVALLRSQWQRDLLQVSLSFVFHPSPQGVAVVIMLRGWVGGWLGG